MLKNRIVSVVTAVLMLSSGVVSAYAFDDTQFSLGAEFSLLNKTGYNNGRTADLDLFKTSNQDSKLAIRKNKPGVNVFFAARFNDYLGLELGFGFIAKARASVQNNCQATNKISNLYGDVLGFMPVASNVDLIGSVGLGRFKSKPGVSGIILANKELLTKTKVGVRAGIGAQYNLANNWSTRGMIRYQKGNKNFLKNNTSVSVGALYTF